jgi:hypothetical protein
MMLEAEAIKVACDIGYELSRALDAKSLSSPAANGFPTLWHDAPPFLNASSE